MKTRGRRIGTVLNTFEFNRDDDFAGGELKEAFASRIPTEITRVGVHFNDVTAESILVSAYAVSWNSGAERMLFQKYGNGRVEYYEDKITLGGDEFLAVKTVGLTGLTPPGGSLIMAGRAAR